MKLRSLLSGGNECFLVGRGKADRLEGWVNRNRWRKRKLGWNAKSDGLERPLITKFYITRVTLLSSMHAFKETIQPASHKALLSRQ